MRYICIVIFIVSVYEIHGEKSQDVSLILTRAFAEDPFELKESDTGTRSLVIPWNITEYSKVEIFASGTLKHGYKGPTRACDFLDSIHSEDKNLMTHVLQAAGLGLKCPIEAGVHPVQNMTSLTIPYDSSTDCFVESLFLGIIERPHTVFYQATFIYGGSKVNTEFCQKMLAAEAL